MSELTTKELATIRERAEKATPGPWETWGTSGFPDFYVGMAKDEDGRWWTKDNTELGQDDAEFIAHARTDVPALLAHIDALTAKLAAGPGEPSLGELESAVVEAAMAFSVAPSSEERGSLSRYGILMAAVERLRASRGQAVAE